LNDLTEAEINVLNEVLDNKYYSWAIYTQIIADFGEVSPFSNIYLADAHNIEVLCTLFANYGLPVSENPWPGKEIRYPSLKAACEARFAAEITNGEMYKRLIKVTKHSDILTVLRNLQAASQKLYLPAFKRCSERLLNN
jgi:hypothetical protein